MYSNVMELMYFEAFTVGIPRAILGHIMLFNKPPDLPPKCLIEYVEGDSNVDVHPDDYYNDPGKELCPALNFTMLNDVTPCMDMKLEERRKQKQAKRRSKIKQQQQKDQPRDQLQSHSRNQKDDVPMHTGVEQNSTQTKLWFSSMEKIDKEYEPEHAKWLQGTMDHLQAHKDRARPITLGQNWENPFYSGNHKFLMLLKEEEKHIDDLYQNSLKKKQDSEENGCPRDKVDEWTVQLRTMRILWIRRTARLTEVNKLLKTTNRSTRLQEARECANQLGSLVQLINFLVIRSTDMWKCIRAWIADNRTQLELQRDPLRHVGEAGSVSAMEAWQTLYQKVDREYSTLKSEREFLKWRNTVGHLTYTVVIIDKTCFIRPYQVVQDHDENIQSYIKWIQTTIDEMLNRLTAGIQQPSAEEAKLLCKDNTLADTMADTMADSCLRDRAMNAEKSTPPEPMNGSEGRQAERQEKEQDKMTSETTDDEGSKTLKAHEIRQIIEDEIQGSLNSEDQLHKFVICYFKRAGKYYHEKKQKQKTPSTTLPIIYQSGDPVRDYIQFILYQQSPTKETWAELLADIIRSAAGIKTCQQGAVDIVCTAAKKAAREHESQSMDELQYMMHRIRADPEFLGAVLGAINNDLPEEMYGDQKDDQPDTPTKDDDIHPQSFKALMMLASRLGVEVPSQSELEQNPQEMEKKMLTDLFGMDFEAGEKTTEDGNPVKPSQQTSPPLTTKRLTDVPKVSLPHSKSFLSKRQPHSISSGPLNRPPLDNKLLNSSLPNTTLSSSPVNNKQENLPEILSAQQKKSPVMENNLWDKGLPNDNLPSSPVDIKQQTSKTLSDTRESSIARKTFGSWLTGAAHMNAQEYDAVLRKANGPLPLPSQPENQLQSMPKMSLHDPVQESSNTSLVIELETSDDEMNSKFMTTPQTSPEYEVSVLYKPTTPGSAEEKVVESQREDQSQTMAEASSQDKVPQLLKDISGTESKTSEDIQQLTKAQKKKKRAAENKRKRAAEKLQLAAEKSQLEDESQALLKTPSPGQVSESPQHPPQMDSDSAVEPLQKVQECLNLEQEKTPSQLEVLKEEQELPKSNVDVGPETVSEPVDELQTTKTKSQMPTETKDDTVQQNETSEVQEDSKPVSMPLSEQDVCQKSKTKLQMVAEKMLKTRQQKSAKDVPQCPLDRLLHSSKKATDKGKSAETSTVDTNPTPSGTDQEEAKDTSDTEPKTEVVAEAPGTSRKMNPPKVLVVPSVKAKDIPESKTTDDPKPFPKIEMPRQMAEMIKAQIYQALNKQMPQKTGNLRAQQTGQAHSTTGPTGVGVLDEQWHYLLNKSNMTHRQMLEEMEKCGLGWFSDASEDLLGNDSVSAIEMPQNDPKSQSVKTRKKGKKAKSKKKVLDKETTTLTDVRDQVTESEKEPEHLAEGSLAETPSSESSIRNEPSQNESSENIQPESREEAKTLDIQDESSPVASEDNAVETPDITRETQPMIPSELQPDAHQQSPVAPMAHMDGTPQMTPTAPMASTTAVIPMDAIGREASTAPIYPMTAGLPVPFNPSGGAPNRPYNLQPETPSLPPRLPLPPGLFPVELLPENPFKHTVKKARVPGSQYKYNPIMDPYHENLPRATVSEYENIWEL
ncbi:hypothetical protein BZA77DRAFT_371864 [Pyronema omphalodes]|nr:hypothetical protein BZA77DRAFT_371864 [Pyronema omphalodes]